MAETGAVDLSKCPDPVNNCKCGTRCMACGFRKHFAVHGPHFGMAPGSKPYDHEYKPVGRKVE